MSKEGEPPAKKVKTEEESDEGDNAEPITVEKAKRMEDKHKRIELPMSVP